MKFNIGDMVYLKHTELVGYVIKIGTTRLDYHIQWLNSSVRTIPISVHVKSQLKRIS